MLYYIDFIVPRSSVSLTCLRSPIVDCASAALSPPFFQQFTVATFGIDDVLRGEELDTWNEGLKKPLIIKPRLRPHPDTD